MKKNLFSFRKVPLLIVFSIIISQMPSFAQSYPYLMDFEIANTSPYNKNAYSSLDTITVDSIRWIMPGVHLGNPVVPPGDFYNDSRSSRIRLTDNTSGDPGYMEMIDDIPMGAGFIQFNTAMYGSGTDGKLLVFYSIDSGVNWIIAGDTINVPPNNAPNLFTRSINQSGKVRVKIRKAFDNDDRINVDDILISNYGLIAHIYPIVKSPEGDSIPLNTNSLIIQYDHLIASGNGTITLHKIGGGIQSFNIPSSAISIIDSTVTISGISLDNAAHYFVLMEDSVFHETGNMATNLSITDTGYWVFSTIDTTPLPQPPNLTTLQESFLACNSEVNMMGVFKQYSIDGGKAWDCSPSGNNDSFCVSMSGGWYVGSSEDNKDWLISVLPFHLSDMQHPVLSLWQKKKYDGFVERNIKISINYSGSGNPLDSNVSWTNLTVPELNISPANSWTLINNIDLEEYKDSLFYLALTYSCADSGAYILYYDNLIIKEQSLQIPKHKLASFSFNILGPTSSNKIILEIDTKKAVLLNLEIYDFNGRKLYDTFLNCKSGKSVHQLSNLNLPSGMYLIRISGSLNALVKKFMIPY